MISSTSDDASAIRWHTVNTWDIWTGEIWCFVQPNCSPMRAIIRFDFLYIFPYCTARPLHNGQPRALGTTDESSKRTLEILSFDLAVVLGREARRLFSSVAASQTIDTIFARRWKALSFPHSTHTTSLSVLRTQNSPFRRTDYADNEVNENAFVNGTECEKLILQ